MKNPILLVVLATLLITACNKDIKEFIEGAYVSDGVGKYSVANDTLVVEHLAGKNYLIHRKTGFNLIREGKKGNRQYETEEWRAVYDEETETLTEIQRGKLITFYPEENKLMVGKREYKKIK